MSLPRNSAAYPPALTAAIQRALDTGIFTIPTPKPMALRLQLQGLRGALRREGKSHDIDRVMFCLQASPPALVLKTRDNTPEALAVLAALSLPQGDNPPPQTPCLADEAEAALSRLLSGGSNA